MTYTELVASIQSYTENEFPDITLADGSTETTAEQINRFIQQAEQRIYNSVQFPSIRKNMTGNLQSGNKYLQAPTDFLAVYSLAVIENYGLATEIYTFFTTAGSSWLGDNFDSVLLYGSLVEAYTFMKGETDLINLYDGKYKEAMVLAKRLGDGMERQDAYRSGQYRQPVT